MKLPAYSAYHWLWQAVDWIYPPSCCGCNQPGTLFCSSCLESITFLDKGLCSLCGYPRDGARRCAGCFHLQPQFTKIRCLAHYDGSIKDAVHQLKYQNNLGLGIELARLLHELCIQQNWPIDLITPVPLSKQRQKERGYNQAAMIAYPLALQLGIPFDDKNLKRIRETSSQVELDVHQRQQNLLNAFDIPTNRFSGKNVLLVDDVITTGATINDCARALKKSGAKEVYAVSVGRVVLKK